MLKLTKQGNSLIVEGLKNGTYPTNGTNEYPLNSLIAVTDDSDMVTFRSAATNDVLFSGKVEDITINGESVTKDNILAKFDAVSNAATGGGGGGGSVDAYTKAESDAKYATKEYAEEIAFNSGNDIKEEIGTYVSEISDYVDNGKINYTVKNIADGYSEPREIPFKTINGQNVLGEGNIEISGSGGSVDAYTKAESDAKYGTKAEQESLRGDVENALGEIAALGYDKADKSELAKYETIEAHNADNEAMQASIDNKQDKLTAGDGITIEDNVISAVGGMDDIKDHFTYEDDYTIDEKSRNVLVKKYVSEYGYNDVIIGNGKYSENESKVFIISEQLEEAIPTYIKEISPNKDYLATFCARRNGTAVTITPDRTLKIHNYPYIIPKRKSEFLYIYESDTKDGDYRFTEPDMNDNYIIKEKKWYKFIIYDVNNVGFFDNNIIFDNFTFQNGTMTVEANAQWTKWDETNIDNSLYYQDGSELTPILTQKNISKYVDIQGGGDVDLSNYPTKQEVNQTYLQKEGEYVKSVSANGGAINFEKGNGTPDVVNLKTVGGQSIIGMDDIPVPTVQSNYKGSDKNYVWSSGDWGSNVHFNVVSDIKCMTNETVSPNYIVLGKRVWGIGQGYSQESIPSATHEKAGAMSAADKKKLDATPSIWFGTQTEYDALGTYDDNTLYLLREDDGYLTI